MTSRRSRLIEDGARELLQFHGYKVRVRRLDSTSGFPRPTCRNPAIGETRFIRITKLFHQSSSVQTVEQRCYVGLAQLPQASGAPCRRDGLHYEIWCYSLSHGFRCFEVHKDSVREIPKLSLYTPVPRKAGGVA